MSTIVFMFSCAMILIGAASLFMDGPRDVPKPAKVAGSLIFMLLFFLLAFSQTAMYVSPDSRGVVTTKFGSPLSNGHVVAFNGERGPQAWTLSPGWNFGLWPWQYSLEEVENIEIPVGKVGVVTAKDGKALKGQTYADEWDSVEDMLDGMKFGEKGFTGPQITVIPAGKVVAYNPYLFDIQLSDALVIKQDKCVVIKSNHGNVPEDHSSKLVPVGSIGIWNVAYGPGTHYINTNAFECITVNTTKRVYSYTGRSSLGPSDRPDHDHSINVKTMDGYKFPVDIIVEVIVTKENAPFVVSEIGDPDADVDGDGFDVLETKVILPSIRSIFRNNADKHNALDYLNSRSAVEADATKQFAEYMKQFEVDVIAVRIADIGLDSTPEGKELLKTQTDQELAKQQIKAYNEQKMAAEAEKLKVEAETAAARQEELTASKIQIEAKENEGLAEAKKAVGEAEAISKKIEAYGGYTQFLMAEAINAFGSNWNGEFPDVLVVGDESKLETGVLGKIMQEQVNGREAK